MDEDEGRMRRRELYYTREVARARVQEQEREGAGAGKRAGDDESQCLDKHG
jgi:hypothetical protein